MDNVVDVSRGYDFGECEYPSGGLYGPRMDSCISLILLHSGEARLSFDDHAYPLNGGECALLRASRSLRIDYARGVHSHVSWCEGQPGNLVQHIQQQLKSLRVIQKLSPRLTALHRIGLDLGLATDVHTNALRNAVGKSLYAAFFYEAQLSERDRYIPSAIQKARLFLEANYSTEITIESLASAAALTPQHLISSFRRHLGVTPIRYLWQFRAEQGRELLYSTRFTVAEIAFRCGFKNQFHFSRQIKKFYGTTPTELRSQSLRQP